MHVSRVTLRKALVWVAIIAAALLILIANIESPVSAQDSATSTATPDAGGPKLATPQPTPDHNGGNATWTVNSSTYQSNYPDGMEWHLDATSSAGKITSAVVKWQHVPGVTKSQTGKIDDSGAISAVWKAASNGVPQWIAVEYWWRLQDEAGNTYETPHQNDIYADNTRNWNHAESDDVVIYWQDGIPNDIGQAVLDAVRKNRPIYIRNWGTLLNFRPHVILYSSYVAFKEWLPGIDTVAMGTNGKGTIVQGLTDGTWGGTAQVYDAQSGVDRIAYGVVLHEIDHLYQKAVAHSVASSDWFIEGDATYFEVVQDYDYLSHVQQMAADGTLPTLQGEGPEVKGANARDGYDIGYAFFKWLAETYGPDAHIKLWQLLAKNKSRVEALQAVTGKNFQDMEIDFRTWLGASDPIPPTRVPTPAFQFPPTPTYDTSFLPQSTPAATP